MTFPRHFAGKITKESKDKRRNKLSGSIFNFRKYENSFSKKVWENKFWLGERRDHPIMVFGKGDVENETLS